MRQKMAIFRGGNSVCRDVKVFTKYFKVELYTKNVIHMSFNVFMVWAPFLIWTWIIDRFWKVGFATQQTFRAADRRWGAIRQKMAIFKDKKVGLLRSKNRMFAAQNFCFDIFKNWTMMCHEYKTLQRECCLDKQNFPSCRAPIQKLRFCFQTHQVVKTICDTPPPPSI